MNNISKKVIQNLIPALYNRFRIFLGLFGLAESSTLPATLRAGFATLTRRSTENPQSGMTMNGNVTLNSIQSLSVLKNRTDSGVTVSNNVILSRSEGSHNIEILRSLCSLRIVCVK